MQAVRLIAPRHLVFSTDVPSRELVDHEIRVRVATTSICGTDLKNFANPIQVPQIPGHEFSGTVIEVAPTSVHSIIVGERVTAFPMMTCMRCEACLSGHRRDCENKLSLGFHLPGSFAQEIIFDGRFAVPLHGDMTFEQGALVEHLACGYRIAREVEQANPGRQAKIVIFGDGPIALGDVQALREKGYDNITVIGKHRARMAIAEGFGASVRDHNDSAPIPHIDICIMAAPASSTLSRFMSSIDSNSILFPQTRFDQSILTIAHERESRMGRAFAYHMQDFNEVMGLMRSGAFATSPLVTTRIDLKDAANMLTALSSDKADHIKVLINAD